MRTNKNALKAKTKEIKNLFNNKGNISTECFELYNMSGINSCEYYKKVKSDNHIGVSG